MDTAYFEEWYKKHSKQILDAFSTFLQFKTIGADPAYDQDCIACAKWLVSYLKKIGLDATLWETSGKPVVFAQHLVAKDRPTLLIYHHYDVQPIDPIELWESDPFSPSVRGGEIFARGAQDNKGQCFFSLTALQAFFEKEKPNFNIKLFIEGEEESGSEGTAEVLHRKELKADYLLVPDTGIPGPGIPAITVGVRGILTMDLEVQTAEIDLHSGNMGGIAYNPLRALCHILSKCYDDEGRVAIPHFYDGVKELSKEEKSQFNLECNEEEIRRDFGVKAFSPEPGFSLGESVSIRPTFEINGMEGGYSGEGFKTVLPKVAKAKISCRLVPDQDPDQIFTEIEKHVFRHTPKGAECKLTKDQGAFAFRANPNSLIAKRVKLAYEEVMKAPCQSILSGGSLPISVELMKAAGAEGLMMGLGLDTDHIHAPNEHFGLDRFEQGVLIMGRILGLFHEG